MFATFTQYRVNPIFKKEFVASWEDFLNHLRMEQYAHSGTLHGESRITYISYIIWTSREKFEPVYNKEVDAFVPLINKLHSICNDVQLLHRMDIIKQNTPFYS
jgi:hypothetical protein